MLGKALWVLRQPRYAALAMLMVIVAVVCVIAGTWQISRYEQTARINKALTANAHAQAVPLTTTLVPLIGHGPAPGREAIRYRTVDVTGTYLPRSQQLIDSQAADGTDGFTVLDPLRTDAGVLLVVRGFIASNERDVLPTNVPSPPSGVVHLSGRLETGSTSNDGAGSLGPGEITAVNPTRQASRLNTPVYNAYLNLNANQPGSAGLTALAEPDLSNPAGGVVEPQHLAYIIQWYLFALLALAAPFVVARHEVRETRRTLLGIDPGAEEFDLKWDREHATELELTETPTSGVALATRTDGTLAAWHEPTTQQWEKAAALADRYGRSLGPDGPTRGNSTPRRRRYFVIPRTADALHRSTDPYHGAYNDYLWQIALADGATPKVDVQGGSEADSPAPISDEIAPNRALDGSVEPDAG